jgi:hypothetical protein
LNWGRPQAGDIDAGHIYVVTARLATVRWFMIGVALSVFPVLPKNSADHGKW